MDIFKMFFNTIYLNYLNQLFTHYTIQKGLIFIYHFYIILDILYDFHQFISLKFIYLYNYLVFIILLMIIITTFDFNFLVDYKQYFPFIYLKCPNIFIYYQKYGVVHDYCYHFSPSILYFMMIFYFEFICFFGSIFILNFLQ
jgi:hypothetical protein